MVNVANAVAAVTLSDVKAHLRIDHSLEDNVLNGLILSATMNAETRIKRPIIDRSGETTLAVCSDVQHVPQSIRQWILLMIGFMYSHRELATAETLNELPYGDSLLDAWRVYE